MLIVTFPSPTPSSRTCILIMFKQPGRSTDSLGKRVKRMISEFSSDLKTFFCHPFGFSKQDSHSMRRSSSLFQSSAFKKQTKRQAISFTLITIRQWRRRRRIIIVGSMISRCSIIFQRSVLIIGLKHCSSLIVFVTFYSIFLFNSSNNSIVIGIVTYANKNEKANGN